MTIDQIRRVAKAEPFGPFFVCLTDGRRFQVKHPECIWIPPESTGAISIAEAGELCTRIDAGDVTKIVHCREPRPDGGFGGGSL